MKLIPAEIIKKKRQGQEHSLEELRAWIDGFVSGQVPDYQMAAWLMAVYFQGMGKEEISFLTQVMRDSGRVLNFSHLGAFCVDKHSTGGVGDKTSLMLTPLVGLFGLKVPMIAGRGLGHTGGTLDKLESIPGFRTNLSLEEFQKQIETLGYAIIGQTAEICPADRKLYALRDVTGTVESLPLICGSIMSKKLAEGLNSLVLDVKFGSGAFMKSQEEAQSLAQLLKTTGERQGVKVTTLLTDTNQPLGRFIGNALEVKECLDILDGRTFTPSAPSKQVDFDYYQPTRELTLQLASHMLHLGGKADSPEVGYSMAQKALESGQAAQAFSALCQAQGGDLARFRGEEMSPRPFAEVRAPQAGRLESMDCEQVGWASLLLGAGRLSHTDKIIPCAGIEVNCRLGEVYQKGDPLFYLYGDSSSQKACGEVEARLLNSLAWDKGQ